MALITAAEARVYLPGLTGTGEDTNIDTLILRAGGLMAAWCGYPSSTAIADPTMESASYTRYLDGPGGRDLVLDVWPVTAITSIYDDEEQDFAATSLVDSGDYAIIAGARGLVRLTSTSTHGAWSTGSETIKATFTAGFSTVPASLKHLCGQTVKHLWQLRRQQGAASSTQGGATVSREEAAALPIEVRLGLGPYILPRALL